MSLDSDVFAYLKTKTGVTNVFGAANDMRIYPGIVPTATTTFPYAEYTRISNFHFHHLQAASGMADAVYQFDVYDDDAVNARTAAEALRAALDGYNEGTMTAVNVRWINLDAERDEFIPPASDNEIGVYRVSQDYMFRHVESVPAF